MPNLDPRQREKAKGSDLEKGCVVSNEFQPLQDELIQVGREALRSSTGSVSPSGMPGVYGTLQLLSLHRNSVVDEARLPVDQFFILLM